MANEYMTKDNMKALEAKILRRLNPPKSILNKRAKANAGSLPSKLPLDKETKVSSFLAGKKNIRNNK